MDEKARKRGKVWKAFTVSRVDEIIHICTIITLSKQLKKMTQKLTFEAPPLHQPQICYVNAPPPLSTSRESS